MRTHRPILVAAALLLCSTYLSPASAREPPPPSPGTIPPNGVIGISEAQLSPDFWGDRLEDPDRVVMSVQAIAAQNEKLLRLDGSMNDLQALPETLKKEEIVASISELSTLPDG